MHSTYNQVITFDSGVNTEKTVIALENVVSDIIDMRNVESFSLLATTTGGAGHDGSPVVVQSILSLADGSWAENGNTYAFDTMSYSGGGERKAKRRLFEEDYWGADERRF